MECRAPVGHNPDAIREKTLEEQACKGLEFVDLCEKEEHLGK